MGFARRCVECPERVKAVCRHAFGKFWSDKSGGGEGCRHPVDGVADAWHAKGWAPDAPERPRTAARRFRSVVLACPPDAPTGVSRAPGAVPPKMPRRPSRPKVSASILKGADLFFGRMPWAARG